MSEPGREWNSKYGTELVGRVDEAKQARLNCINKLAVIVKFSATITEVYQNEATVS